MVPPPSGSQPRCGNPACGRPIERQAIGRPACYCSGSCRQAVHRERVRLADAERQRAGRLHEATSAAARLWRELERAAREAARLANAVLAYADGDDGQDLASAIAGHREAALRLQGLAGKYFDTAGLAKQLCADPAVRGQYRGPEVVQATAFRARENATRRAASTPREHAGIADPGATKPLAVRVERADGHDGEADQPVSLPLVRDTGDTQGAPPGSGTQTPQARPPWSWSTA
jgi:hypothetical protein